MPILRFLPSQTEVDVAKNTKILAAARKLKIPIRFGCGAGRCGLCAVKVDKDASKSLNFINEKEKDLLSAMKLPWEAGDIRLACQARIEEGTCTVDLDFQSTYSPDVGLLE